MVYYSAPTDPLAELRGLFFGGEGKGGNGVRRKKWKGYPSPEQNPDYGDGTIVQPVTWHHGHVLCEALQSQSGGTNLRTPDIHRYVPDYFHNLTTWLY